MALLLEYFYVRVKFNSWPQCVFLLQFPAFSEFWCRVRVRGENGEQDRRLSQKCMGKGASHYCFSYCWHFRYSCPTLESIHQVFSKNKPSYSILVPSSHSGWWKFTWCSQSPHGQTWAQPAVAERAVTEYTAEKSSKQRLPEVHVERNMQLISAYFSQIAAWRMTLLLRNFPIFHQCKLCKYRSTPSERK